MRNFTIGAWVVPMFLVAGASGCREPEVKSERSSPACPTCKTETRVMPVLGLEYDHHVCPQCRKEQGFPDLPYEEVHVCDRCKTIVEECPQCRERR